MAKNQAVRITAENGSGSATVMSAMDVVGFPAALIGTSTGLADRDPVNRNLGARLTWTITAQGSFTGTYSVGTIRTPFAGQAVVQDDGMNPVTANCEARFVIGDCRYILAHQVSPGGQGSGTIMVNDINGNHVATVAERAWPSLASPSDYTGRYTFALQVVGAPVSNVPQGYGFGSISVNSTGMASIAGQAGDGSVISASAPVDVEGKVVCYAPLYNGNGTIVALPKITPVDGRITGPGSWNKLSAAALSNIRLYPSGWEVSTLLLEGSAYVPPDRGKVVMGLNYVAGTPNAALMFASGGLMATPPAPDVDLSLNGAGVMDALGKLKNPRSTTVAVSPATGSFNGSFVMVDMMPNGVPLTRVVPFAGQIVRLLPESPQNQGRGYFLLPQLPGSDVTPMPAPGSTPILSGSVLLTPKM